MAPQRENVLPFDDPISPREIGQHLRHMLDVTNTTRDELAARTHYSARTIEAWCEGRRLEKVACVLAAFEALGCTVKILPPQRRPVKT